MENEAETPLDPNPIDLIEPDATRPFSPISREEFLDAKADDFNPSRDIIWVYNALGVDPEQMKPTDAPSPGAWRLLHEAYEEPTLLKAFYAGPFGKMLASFVQTEQEKSRVEDGRAEFGLIDRLLSEPDDIAPILTDTERRARELALQRTYPQGGVSKSGTSERAVDCVPT